jgi:hypothetical protein
LALAIIWVFIWPSNKSVESGSMQFIILRWFHALVWMLLAAAGFVAGSGVEGGMNTAKLIALVPLAVYLVFMFTIVTSK